MRWGWRALAVQGLGDLRLPDPDKDRHCAVGRRPHRPEPERLICPIGVRRSRQRMLPCTDLPAQSVADLFRHCLRQQAERLPPGRPEGFSVLTRSTDRSVSEDRTEAAVLKGLEE